MESKKVTPRPMEIVFEEIKRNYLPHIKDDRTLIKWLEEEKVDYFTDPKRCFKVEFVTAFQAKQLRDVKKQNPLDYEKRIERLIELESQMFNAVSFSPIIASNLLPKANEIISSVNPKSENSPIKNTMVVQTSTEVRTEFLKLSNKDCPIGLHRICNKCKYRYTGKCRNKKENKCYPDRHTYRLEVNTKATGRLFATEEFDNVFDEKEAKDIARKLREKIIANGGKVKLPLLEEEENQDYGIIEVLMKKHLSYMRDEEKEDFEKLNLFNKWVNRTESKYDLMKSVIKNLGFKVETFRIEQLSYKLENKKTVKGILIEEVKKREGRNGTIKNPTYNDYIKTYKYLFDFGMNKCGQTLNPFEEVQLKSYNANRNIRILTPIEFKTLCELIQSQKEIHKDYKSGGKNFYRDYLVDGIKLGLYSAFRNVQLAELRFSNILLSEDGQLVNSIIEIEDFKTNHQYKLFSEEEKRYNYVRINYDLAELIISLGYQEFRFTNEFISAINSTCQRNTIANQLSNSFREYTRILFPTRELKFKHLRKTHISSMSESVGAERTAQVWHEDSSVTKANYIYFKKLIPSADEFKRIF